MSDMLRRLSPHVASLAAALCLAGCGGSSVDLDKEYGLNDPANQLGPGKTVAGMVADMESKLRGREVPPKAAVAELQENLENYQPSQFGDKASEFEKIKAGVDELKQMADQGKPKAQLQEKAGALKDQADQLAGASGSAPAAG